MNKNIEEETCYMWPLEHSFQLHLRQLQNNAIQIFREENVWFVCKNDCI